MRKRLAQVNWIDAKDDLLVVAGVSLICVGVWQVFQPAALAIAGAVLLWVGLPTRPPFVGRD